MWSMFHFMPVHIAMFGSLDMAEARDLATQAKIKAKAQSFSEELDVLEISSKEGDSD